jgi:hypothetical protein
VRRFQDLKDHSSTANLKHHAKKCFRDEAVKNAEGQDNTQSGSKYLLPSLVKPGCLPGLPTVRTQIKKFGMYIIFLISLISTNTMLSSVHTVLLGGLWAAVDPYTSSTMLLFASFSLLDTQTLTFLQAQ